MKTVDLSNCDREPIHVPGNIQPHGCLLVLDPVLQVVQASENAAPMLGVKSVLGSQLGDLVVAGDGGNGAAALSNDSLHAHPIHLRDFRSRSGESTFDAIAHRMDDHIVLELEPAATSPHNGQIHRKLQLAIADLRAAESLDQLLTGVARHVRTLTGFDRVMIYRFDAEWNGEVVREERRHDLEPFLGLHYPASDIPRQARELYTRNWLRFIADRDYVPVPVLPSLNPVTGKPLDMSFSVLRSVSPIHIEYLRNMGVGASLSISLLRDGQLWGLVACHHYSARRIPFELRAACELLGQVVSLQIAAWEQRELAIAVAGRQGLINQIVADISMSRGLAESLAQNGSVLLSLVDAGGAAIVVDEQVTRIGQTPPESRILEAIEAIDLLQVENAPVCQTDHLSGLIETTRDEPVASGLMMLSISKRAKQRILWFRPEQSRVVDWAGDPAKSIAKGDGGEGRLSPRGSFALWKETVRGRCLPWTASDLATASELRREVLDKILSAATDLSRHNQLLRRARDEKDQMLASERAARAEAERVNRIKDEFVAVLSHELRTPLTAIRGWSQLLQSKFAGQPQLAHGLDVIARNARSQSQMIEDLLDISRITSGKIRLDVQPVDLPAVVESAVTTVELAAQSKDITITRFIDPMTGLVVTGDPHRLQQVVWNLLSNAVKFTPKKGKIRVELRRVSSHVELIISDTGIGISPDFLPHVFDRFKQADASATRQHGGLGLGLSIVRHLVELHGGSIAADSRGQNMGSTFTVSLPMRAITENRDTVRSNSRFLDCTELHLEGVRVLVVDDELDTRDMLQHVLEDCGIIVRTAESVTNAMAEVYENAFDVLISDIGMPGQDGYHLIQMLRDTERRSKKPKLPAIALTAYARPEDRQRIMLAGFQVHLAKPVEPAELLAVVASLAGRI